MRKRYPGAKNYFYHKYGKDYKQILSEEQIKTEKEFFRKQWEEQNLILNHKIIKIESCGFEEVFDIEVE